MRERWLEKKLRPMSISPHQPDAWCQSTRGVERRAMSVELLPWCIPASVVMRLTDEDLDELADASEERYWTVLNRIVGKLERGQANED
jgi:hypothetical protein